MAEGRWSAEQERRLGGPREVRIMKCMRTLRRSPEMSGISVGQRNHAVLGVRVLAPKHRSPNPELVRPSGVTNVRLIRRELA
jgi:hypothetical protein